MNLNEYQNKAITSKIYDDSVAIPYVVLGICGETAELYEKIVEAIGIGDDANLDLLSKETADILWYLAAWAEENGLMLEDIAKMNDSESFNTIGDMMDDLIKYSGQIAEFSKKALRDDFADISKGIYPASKMEKTNVAVANLLSTVKSVVSFYNLDFDTCLQENIDKLASRAARGKIGGSGDER
tara:strand:- start:1129 stop:1680 length:552 start_codon:yes stop_codon:yes gene_type:complete